MRIRGIDTESFAELLDSVREGGEILRGEREPSRRYVVDASGVQAMREGDLGSGAAADGSGCAGGEMSSPEPGLALNAIHRG